MISVFKNFYQKPAVLKSDAVTNFLSETIKAYSDGKKNVDEFFPSNPAKIYSHPDVLNALRKLYHGKCAYCEQLCESIVDHFRPQSIYSWLIFEWSNLLPACKDCNIAKSNRFEIGARGRLLNSKDILNTIDFNLANSSILLEEQALLIHPEIDSPENHLTFNGEGFAIGRTEKGRSTIECCKLNRQSLVLRRFEKISTLKSSLKRVVRETFLRTTKLQGQFFNEKMPSQVSEFFEEFFNFQDVSNEFSRLHQVLWEEPSYLFDDLDITELNDDKEYSLRVTSQLKIWKQIFLLGKNDLSTSNQESVKLISFDIQHFEGIVSTSVRKLPVSAKWIFLTGENGYGKSTILKSIAAGILGNDLENSEARIKIDILLPSMIRDPQTQMEYNDDTIEVKNTMRYDIAQKIWQSDLHKPYTNVAAYGPQRISLSLGKAINLNVLGNLFNENYELLNIEKYLTDIFFREKLKYKFNKIVETLKFIIPHLAKIEIDDSKDIPEVVYFEKSGDTNFSKVKFNQLATGMRSVIAVVGDIICRFATDEATFEPRNIEGIVIIDEVDIHLHPKWQKELPNLLSSAFPKIQFIASTHSPIPLLGAPEGSVFLRVNRTLEEGVNVSRLKKMEEDIKNLLPNSVFTSDIFDLDNIQSTQNKNFDEIKLENNFDDIERNRELEERLKKIDKSIFPDNLFKKE